MADHDDPLNSSDLEIPDAPPSRFAKAGADSIRKLIESKVEDRRNSKIFEKTLQFGRGVPSTKYNQNLWANRFNAMRTKTLNQNLNDTPDGETIRRFLSTIALKTKSSDSGKPAPSEGWLVKGFGHIVDYCRFQFKDFKLTSQDSIKTSTYFDRLVSEGKLIRGRWRKLQWVGYTLVLRILKRWYTYALEEGTWNFDVTVTKALSISLMACAGNRSGDIARNYMGSPLAWMRWEHVKLVITDGEFLEEWDSAQASSSKVDYAQHYRNIVGHFTIAYAKGFKEDASKNFTFQLRPLDDPEDNAACPIASVLALGLRLGQVYGTTIREVLDHALQRSDRVIPWLHPELPLLCGCKPPAFRKLDLEKPAQVHQLSETLERAALLAGIVVKITPHSLRRGHAKDVANLKKKGFKGATTLETAATMNHSYKAFTLGVTKAYAGDIEEHIWNLKAAEKYTSPFGLKVTDNVFKPSQKATPPAKVIAYAREVGLDPDIPKERKKASKWLKRKKVEDWRQAETENAAPMKKARQGDKVTTDARGSKTTEVLRQLSKNEVNVVQAAVLQPVTTTNGTSNEAADLSTNAGDDDDGTENPQFSITLTDTSTIDPQLLDPEECDPSDSAAASKHSVDTGGLRQLIFSGYHNSSGDNDSLDIYANHENGIENSNGGSDEDLALQVIPQAEIMQLPSLDFIDGLAKHNVYRIWRYCRAPDNTAIKEEFTVSGNSRDEPSPFMLKCTKTLGCDFTTSNSSTMQHHETTCTAARSQRKQEIKETGYPFACDLCDRRFSNKALLNTHRKEHDWVAKPCEDGCFNEKNFKTKKAYLKHRRVYHEPGWSPIECPMKTSNGGCKRKTTFATRTAAEKHMVEVHKIQVKAAKALLTPKQSKVKEKAKIVADDKDNED